MPPRRRIPPDRGLAALTAVRRGAIDRVTWGDAVRFTLEELAVAAPGHSVEVRVPPYGVIQCVSGPDHRRGTPANTVETDPTTWLALAEGRLSWDEALRAGSVRASGRRAELSAYLPLVSPKPGPPADPVAPG